MDNLVILILLLLTVILVPTVYFILGVIGKKLQFNKFNKDTIISKVEEKFTISPYNKGSEYTPQFRYTVELYKRIETSVFLFLTKLNSISLF